MTAGLVRLRRPFSHWTCLNFCTEGVFTVPNIFLEILSAMGRGLQLLPRFRPARLQQLPSALNTIEAASASADVSRCSALEATALASAIGEAGIAVLVIDFDVNAPGLLISDANLPFQDVTGYAAEELVGRSPRELQALFNRSILCQLNRSLLDGQVFRSESVIERKGGDECAVERAISPLRDEHGAPSHWIALLRNVTQGRRLRQEFEAELQHRTRNLLGTVQSMASRTLGDTDKATALGSRLAALGRVQGLETCAEKKVDLGELICTEIEAHGAADEQVTIEGETVAFPRAKAEMLALAVHELTTSAHKHGALSSRGGVLSVRWHTHGSGGHRRLTLRWEETRGQASHAIGLRQGYDRELLERALPFSLGATTKLEIGSEGVRCHIDMPLPEAAGRSFPVGSASSRSRVRSGNDHTRAATR